MHTLFFYDVDQSRVAKVHRYLTRRLFWIQRSVFEGEISSFHRRLMIEDLSRFLDPETDSILTINTEAPQAWKRTVLGRDLAPQTRLN